MKCCDSNAPLSCLYGLQTGESQFHRANAPSPNGKLPKGPDWLYELKFDGYRAFGIKSGARDPRNLWPEPYKTQIDGQTVGARQKDTVENYIHNAICFNVPGHKTHGTAAHASMALRRGQEILAGDWYACFVAIKQGKDCR